MSSSTAGKSYRIAIVGAGALGLSFAARLVRIVPVAVVARNAAAAERLRAGIEIAGERVRLDAYGADDLPAAESVIVLVKTGDTEAAARTALAMRPREVLSLQNGLVEERLRAALGGAIRAGQGVTTAGAWRDGDRVVPVGVGETLVPAGFEAVAALLESAGLPARVAPDIRAAQLAKFLVNLALNPVTAIFRVRNGALRDPPYCRYVDALVREAWPVLRAEGLALDEAGAQARVAAVIDATAANRSSMLQDVETGRPTELDALTGAFIAMASRQRVAVPTHEAVFRLVSLVDGGAPDSGQPPAAG